MGCDFHPDIRIQHDTPRELGNFTTITSQFNFRSPEGIYCIYKQPFGIKSIVSRTVSLITLQGPHSLRVIPQGTVDNNLGPDHLADPKAQDPNYCRQPTL